MSEIESIREQLSRIESKVSAQKPFLNIDEAADFLGMSKSTIYKRTSEGSIPHHAPNTGRLYFSRRELEEWILNSD